MKTLYVVRVKCYDFKWHGLRVKCYVLYLITPCSSLVTRTTLHIISPHLPASYNIKAPQLIG